jgi:hypothetical protein
MRAVWEAQPREQHSAKRQKTNNNNNNNNNNNKGGYQKNNGDFHTLLDQVERVKDSLERAIQQQQTTTGKRKSRDEKQEIFDDERCDEKFLDRLDTDTLVCELDQLSISDDDQMTSQDLSDTKSHE